MSGSRAEAERQMLGREIKAACAEILELDPSTVPTTILRKLRRTLGAFAAEAACAAEREAS